MPQLVLKFHKPIVHHPVIMVSTLKTKASVAFLLTFSTVFKIVI